MWFRGWAEIWRVLVFTLVGYALMLTLVRLAGKRSISNKNASDFILTVAVGSAMSTMILSTNVSLAAGCAAVIAFMAIQFTIAASSTRSDLARRLVESQPVLLLFEGRPRRHVLVREKVNDTELLAAVRNAGLASLADVYAVVLEIDGSFSIIADRPADPSAMKGVRGFPG
jgi:uncharacterized membrane protein YcaP (DUF421 family)